MNLDGKRNRHIHDAGVSECEKFDADPNSNPDLVIQVCFIGKCGLKIWLDWIKEDCSALAEVRSLLSAILVSY